MKTVSELLSGNRSDIAVTAAVALAMSLALSTYARNRKKVTTREARRLPPMPKTTLPILKSLLDTSNNVERFHDWIHEQSTEFGNRPWMFAIPGRPVTIVLTSPETIEDVLATQSDVFLRGPVGLYMSKDIFGNGMIITDGDPWHFHRKTASHLFSMKMMKDVMVATVREKVEVFLDIMDIYYKRGNPFSFKKELNHFTMDVISKIGFGLELDTLKNSPDRDEDHEFLDAVDNAAVAFAVRVQSPKWLWELKRYFNIGWEKVFKDNVRILYKLIDDIILESMKKKTELAAKGEKRVAKDLIALFMESSNLRESSDMRIEDDDATIMRDMVMTFIFAGKDSTAHGMSWFLVRMNRHPEVLRKIRAEMREKLPGLFTGEIRVPTQEQIYSLVFLEAAVKENIRLTPSTGFLAREAMQDTTLVDGTFVQKGQTIMISSYSSARNTKTWGEDAREFKPERMINPKTGKLRLLSPYAYSAFGSGPHACIGQKFSMMQMKLTLATLLSKFDIKTVEDPWKLTYEFSITIPVKGPLDVVITPLPVTCALVA